MQQEYARALGILLTAAFRGRIHVYGLSGLVVLFFLLLYYGLEVALVLILAGVCGISQTALWLVKRLRISK
jgi:hypothetical protein